MQPTGRKEIEMTKFYGFELEDGICRTFTSVSSLRRWLERRMDECGSPEAFSEWLTNYFEEGNEISVHGEQYDFWACWELV